MLLLVGPDPDSFQSPTTAAKLARSGQDIVLTSLDAFSCGPHAVPHDQALSGIERGEILFCIFCMN